ncbi:hypothetical protein LTR17_025865 [Elasticomyces elasticus]|nr:hypothetical protein LTR17_025865 [Elasticomyces elasticus]
MAPNPGMKRRRGSSSSSKGLTDPSTYFRGAPLIDLCDSSDEDDLVNQYVSEDENDESEMVQPDAGVLSRGQAISTRHSLRSPPPTGYQPVPSTTTNMGMEITLAKDQCDVELHSGDYQGEDFLRVRVIMQHRKTGNVLLRGTLLRRTMKMDKMLPKTRNEVCAILLDVDPNDAYPVLDDYLVDVPLHRVLMGRSVILTNRPFAGPISHEPRKWKDHSFRECPTMSDVAAEEAGVLCCRWKRVEYDSADGKRGYTGAILRLRNQEADLGKGIPDPALVHWWRELAAKDKGPLEFPDPTSDEDDSEHRTKRQRQTSLNTTDFVTRTSRRSVVEEENVSVMNASVHTPKPELCLRKQKTTTTSHEIAALIALISEPRTHSDFFAGPGGMATGAQVAGSIIKFLLDENPNCCNTLRLAFPGAQVLELNVSDFIIDHFDLCCKSGTSHFSFPCNTLSKVYTRRGKDHDKNEDAGTAIGDLLKRTRAKICTFEQTDGLLRLPRNIFIWKRLVQDITSQQYSLRWRIVDATKHNNASKRSRLIILAACPGHPVPDYSPDRTTPKRTMRMVYDEVDALARIEPHMQQHSIKNKPPLLDDNITLPYTILCKSGKHDVYKSGQRSHNMQELAMLAGFPWWRKFAPASMTALRRQIGDAVPVGLATDSYKMVHGTLDWGEEEMAQWLVDAGLLGNEDVIVMRKKQKKRREDAEAEAIRKEGALRLQHRAEGGRKPKLPQAPIVLDDDDIITID